MMSRMCPAEAKASSKVCTYLPHEQPANPTESYFIAGVFCRCRSPSGISVQFMSHICPAEAKASGEGGEASTACHEETPMDR